MVGVSTPPHPTPTLPAERQRGGSAHYEFNLYHTKSLNSNILFVLMSNEKIDFFLKKMGMLTFMVIFPYVSLNWCQYQEGACKYKLKKIKYTYIEWFFCHREENSLIFYLFIIFIINIFLWFLEMCSIARIMNRERIENRESLFYINFPFSILSSLYRLLYLQWYNSKHLAWRPKLHFLQYTKLPLHPGKLHHCCEPLAIQWLILLRLLCTVGSTHHGSVKARGIQSIFSRMKVGLGICLQRSTIHLCGVLHMLELQIRIHDWFLAYVVTYTLFLFG